MSGEKLKVVRLTPADICQQHCTKHAHVSYVPMIRVDMLCEAIYRSIGAGGGPEQAGAHIQVRACVECGFVFHISQEIDTKRS